MGVGGVYCVSLMKKYRLDIAKVKLMARKEKKGVWIQTGKWDE